jgi:phosphoglycerol transferase MdoB-like AlkP superfamily enzyme
MAPHTPLVMDEKGNRLNLLSLTTSLNKKTAYINQVKGVNVWMSKTIDDILKSSPNSIILIQGDHGSRFIQGVDKKKESVSVFLAYLGPGKDSLESINSSNEIFNFLFEKLKDSK